MSPLIHKKKDNFQFKMFQKSIKKTRYFYKSLAFSCLVILSLAIVVLTYGCGQQKQVTPPSFNKQLAWLLCTEAASMVPRHSGTPGALQQAEFISRIAKKFKANVQIDSFKAITPEGELTFRNVIATVKGKSDKYLIIGCHYDGKKLMSVPNFQAANDGASGVGVLLAMIEAVANAKEKPFYTLKFVFFDGEECFYEYTENDGFFGSKHLCIKLKESGELKNCRALILADMIGDRDLKITLSSDTPQEMFDHCIKSAKKHNLEQYFIQHPNSILDDHTPFAQAGIPTIDLIDFNYGPENSYWHTSEDTLDKLSIDSLDIIGRVMLEMIYNMPEKK